MNSKSRLYRQQIYITLGCSVSQCGASLGNVFKQQRRRHCPLESTAEKPLNSSDMRALLDAVCRLRPNVPNKYLTIMLELQVVIINSGFVSGFRLADKNKLTPRQRALTLRGRTPSSCYLHNCFSYGLINLRVVFHICWYLPRTVCQCKRHECEFTYNLFIASTLY